MNKAKLNYWTDLLIAAAFVSSSVSGVVFLLPAGSSTALGIGYRTWDQIHTWSSLLMICGVLAHLVLHWKWILAMSRKTFFFPARPAPSTLAYSGAAADRRHFMRTAGTVAFALGAVAMGYRSIVGEKSTAGGPPTAGNGTILTSAEGAPAVGVTRPVLPADPAAAAPEVAVPTPSSVQAVLPTVTNTPLPANTPAPTSTPAPVVVEQRAGNSRSAQRITVACPKGFVNDPYPGRCRHYVDRDGDGICDLSIPIYG